MNTAFANKMIASFALELAEWTRANPANGGYVVAAGSLGLAVSERVVGHGRVADVFSPMHMSVTEDGEMTGATVFANSTDATNALRGYLRAGGSETYVVVPLPRLPAERLAEIETMIAAFEQMVG